MGLRIIKKYSVSQMIDSYKKNLKKKIVNANNDLAVHEYQFRVQ